MFDEYHGQILNAIDERMKDLIMAPTVAAIETCNEVFADSVLESTRNSNIQEQHRLYTYSSKMWHVPRNFIFPGNAKLLTGWQLWIGGQPGYNINKIGEGEHQDEVQLAPVRPFRELSRKFLPKEPRKIFSLS